MAQLHLEERERRRRAKLAAKKALREVERMLQGMAVDAVSLSIKKGELGIAIGDYRAAAIDTGWATINLRIDIFNPRKLRALKT